MDITRAIQDLKFCHSFMEYASEVHIIIHAHGMTYMQPTHYTIMCGNVYFNSMMAHEQIA